ncbi:MAG: glycine--tRNA ligase subunit beta [Thermodesulfobacteriota bacterium]
MKGEFLLEIGTEEIPAGFLPPAMDALSDLFHKAMETSRIAHGPVKIFGTPRRLVLAATDVDEMQKSVEIEKTGPPVSSAYDAKGKPTKAAVGFARSQGVDVKDLVKVQTPKGEQIAVRKREEGRPTSEVLSDILPGLLSSVPFPKTMRWMDLDVRFARPIHWIVALFDGKVIPFGYGNIKSGAQSRGHRFTHPQGFRVRSFKELASKLESQGVIIDQGRRKTILAEKIDTLAQEQGLRIFKDEVLLDEVTHIVESPYPIMGEFDPEFLELPASILITCMKKHQRYFSLQDGDGRITNRFVAINNTPVKDPEVSVKGHQRVLKARLEDARFYFREDRKQPLIDRLEALKGVVFHSKLGTSFEKVERFTALAKHLAEKLAPARVADVERAAQLCKCDLETGIVYEFPELQGIIGSYYAKMDGEKDEVAGAIREHYLPAFAGDDLPQGIVGTIVSVADRIDTMAGCFSVGLIPTGAADPYALRRHALGIIQILIQSGKPVDLPGLVRQAVSLVGDKRTRETEVIEQEVIEFIRRRFVNFHVSRDYPLDVVEAVVRARFDDLVDARQRVEGLHRWKQRSDFDDIIIGFKRVVNILKGVEPALLSKDLLTEKSEKALFKAFEGVRKKAAPMIEKGDYFAALEVIADLKPPIDKFFDEVMVMVEDTTIRGNRLGLLKTIADFFANVADFSFIGSTA